MNKITYFILFVAAFLYAYIRYIMVGTTPVEDVPLFITNKAVSFLIILILFIYTLKQLLRKEQNSNSQNIFPFVSFLIIAHILMSLSIFSPEYYSKFFSGLKLNINGSLSILSGIVATALVFSKIKTSNILLLFFVATHLFFMGYKGWVTPEKWNGYMPPITLLCFILVLLTIAMQQKIKNNKEF